MSNYSTVYLREEGQSILVKNGLDKPVVSNETIHKWQNTLNLLSEILEVPASLIMKMTDTDMEVFLKSEGTENPYPADGKDSLGHGLYCETVIGRDGYLYIKDSLQDQHWKDNPDVKLNMISYMGFPIRWPDGAVFGTICSLDSKPIRQDERFKKLMHLFRDSLEADLYKEEEYASSLKEIQMKERMIREAHHRIKNSFNLIIRFVQLKKFGNEVDINTLLMELEGKIRAVSLVHEKIYQSFSFDVSTKDYVEELVRSSIHSLYGKDIDCVVKVEDQNLGKNIVNIGILLVELITNSIKYVFSKSENSQEGITVKLFSKGDELFLEYQDSGTGQVEISESGYGTLLFNGLTEHYGGRFQLVGNNLFRLVFKTALIAE